MPKEHPQDQPNPEMQKAVEEAERILFEARVKHEIVSPTRRSTDKIDMFINAVRRPAIVVMGVVSGGFVGELIGGILVSNSLVADVISVGCAAAGGGVAFLALRRARPQ